MELLCILQGQVTNDGCSNSMIYVNVVAFGFLIQTTLQWLVPSSTEFEIAIECGLCTLVF
jgi:hypothetical protein